MRVYSFKPTELDEINELLSDIKSSPEKYNFMVREHHKFEDGKRMLYLSAIEVHQVVLNMREITTFYTPAIFHSRMVNYKDVREYVKNIERIIKTYHCFLTLFEDQTQTCVEVASNSEFHYIKKSEMEEFFKASLPVMETNWMKTVFKNVDKRVNSLTIS